MPEALSCRAITSFPLLRLAQCGPSPSRHVAWSSGFGATFVLAGYLMQISEQIEPFVQGDIAKSFMRARAKVARPQ